MKIKANYISKYIRSRRTSLDMSQQALQKSLNWNGKSAQYISNVELGKCSFPSKDLRKLSEALQVDREILIDLMVRDYRDSLVNEVNAEIIRDTQLNKQIL